MRVAIVGAGITGLSLAYELLKRDHTVTVFEGATHVGGELATVEVGGESVERFYHHLFTHDHDMVALASDLQVDDRVEWMEPEMGYYTNRRVYPFTSPIDLLRFDALSLSGRARLALGTMLLQRTRDFRVFEDRTAAEVLPQYVGQEAFEVVFASLLRAKFADHWESISMAWMWARLMARARTRTRDKRRERLGYFRGSFRVIPDALAASVVSHGADLRLRTRVEAITLGDSDSPVLWADGSAFEADAVVATVGLPIIRRLIPRAHHGFATSLATTAYVGACVVLLHIREQLSRFYWTSIGDRDLPFAGLIEHTNFVDCERYGGARLLYISNYLPAGHEFFQLSDDRLVERFINPIARVFPRFERQHIVEAWVSRDPVAQPVIAAGYQRRKPSYSSPIRGFYICNTSQIYPEDRGTNHNVRIARECADQLEADASSLIIGCQSA